MSNSETSWTAACQALLSKGLPWKNTGEGCHFLLQGIFPTQGSNSSLLHWQVDSFPLSHPGSPCVCVYIYIYIRVCVCYMCAICICVCVYICVLYRRTIKKKLHDPDNHNAVITYLEPDILWKVKWALGSNTANKATGGDGIPVDLFQILKDDAVKCCTQYTSKFGKLTSGHRTGKDLFTFQSQRQCQRMFKLPHNCTHLTH